MTDMNTDQEKTRSSVVKGLAIIGLLSVIILVVWGSIQLIRVLPSAFSSLASVAETIYTNRPVDTLTVATNKSIVNAGEAFTVSWTDLGREGEYSFYYTCTEGVSVDVHIDEETQTVGCGEPMALPRNENSLNITVYSERQRFVDVPFAIAFTPEGDTESLFERKSSVTIVNATIPQGTDGLAEDEESGAEEDEDDETQQEETQRPAQESGAEQRTVTVMPQSYESGFTDLKITYLGVGILENDEYTPASSMDSDERGAIRFEVKNIGTKTSEEWVFEATLPTGTVYESESQEALRPNERAVYTLGFDVAGERGVRDFGVTLSAPNETNKGNNSFEWSVEVN